MSIHKVDPPIHQHTHLHRLLTDVNQALRSNNLQQAALAGAAQTAAETKPKREIRLSFDEKLGKLSVEILDPVSQEVIRTLEHETIVDLLGQQTDYRGLVVNTKA